MATTWTDTTDPETVWYEIGEGEGIEFLISDDGEYFLTDDDHTIIVVENEFYTTWGDESDPATSWTNISDP